MCIRDSVRLLDDPRLRSLGKERAFELIGVHKKRLCEYACVQRNFEVLKYAHNELGLPWALYPAEPVNDDVCIKRPAKKEDCDPNRRSGEVPKAELQALQLVQKHASPQKTYMESISVAKEEEEALWIEHFEGKFQSQDQLRKGFNLTRPIPMILDGELRISTDPTEVYLELLDRFGKEDLNLRENEDT